MCKGCEIRTRAMVSASADADALHAFLADALAGLHDDGAAVAISQALPRLHALAVKIAGPTLRAPPAPPTGPQQGPDEAPAPPPPAPANPPVQIGSTHAARSAAAMDRSAA